MIQRVPRPSSARARRVRAAAGVLAVAALLAGCSSTVAGSAQPAAGAADASASQTSGGADPSTAAGTGDIGPVPKGLEAFYRQQLDWQGCQDYAETELDQQTYGTEGLQCARLKVPVSYADPGKGEATVGVMKAPATGSAEQRIGSVVFNPGGPGGSGMSMIGQFAAYDIGTDLRARFDLVGFDPRGTGASRPAVTCRTDAERDAERAANLRTNTDAGIAAMNAAAVQVADWCAERTGKQEGISGAAFLASVGTTDVAKDMDVLRAALGDRHLTYVGYSYGTRLGTVYAEQFGDNVRAMILDGAIDPNLDPGTEVINQGKSFQDAFGAFAQWCAGQPTCVLGKDPAKATAVYQHLVRALLAKPLKLSDGRVLSFDDANTGTIQAMYAKEFWPTLADGLLALSRGDGDALMKLADQYEDRDSSGHYSNLMDAFLAIRCMDDARIDPAKAAELNKRYYQMAPFLDPGDPVVAVKDSCNAWPAEPTLTAHAPEVGGLQTKPLVISTTGDPATPYQAGVDLAKDLNGALLTVTGNRHTAYLGAGIACADTIGTDYLVNLTIPAADAKC